MNTITMTVPEWTLPYLVNADTSNINATELDQINNFMRSYGLLDIVEWSSESFFQWRNPVDSLGGMCVEATFITKFEES